ncbi:hypothetical protein TTHERM_001395377, partial (macronuclear) [Tetrahymena thermophila SB210]
MYNYDQFVNFQFKVYDDFIIAKYESTICLINIYTTENIVKQFDFNINNFDFIKDDGNIIQVNGVNYFLILDTKLNIIQYIFNYSKEYDLACSNFKLQIACYNDIFSFEEGFILIYHKVQKFTQYIQLGQSTSDYSALFDQEFENIYILSVVNKNYRVYSSSGVLKQTFEKINSVCKLFTQKMLCESENNSLLIIDRLNLVIENQIKHIRYKSFDGIEFIQSFNYLVFLHKDNIQQISVYDITAKKEINQIRIMKQTLSNNNFINKFYLDQILSNYVMFLDQDGIFYISSLDPKYPFYSYLKTYDYQVCCKPSSFVFDSLSNDIYFTYQSTLYKVDYYSLGQQNEPQLNEPYSLFTQLYINSQQNDYLILNQGGILFRYSQQKLQFELSTINSRIIDIKYNQKNDVLILGLVDSILFYQQYQQRQNKKQDPFIYQLDSIQFQQSITDNIVITNDHQILHLNLLKGSIMN